MFCSKCGKEIADEAVICPGCGCATANYHQVPKINNNYSQDYVALTEFTDNVNSLYTISIFSLILFLGIGLLFSMGVWGKAKSITIPQVETVNPNEIAMFQSSKRKLKKALGFANIPLYTLLILLAPALLYTAQIGAAALIVGIYVVLLIISTSCTKHLTETLK